MLGRPGARALIGNSVHVGAWTAASTAPITMTADLINTKKGRRAIGARGASIGEGDRCAVHAQMKCSVRADSAVVKPIFIGHVRANPRRQETDGRRPWVDVGVDVRGCSPCGRRP
jgi:hypothetical protein